MQDSFSLDAKPRLRHGISINSSHSAEQFYLTDPLHIANTICVAPQIVQLLMQCKGKQTLQSIADSQALRGMSAETVIGIIQSLDSALFLDSPTFNNYITGPIRRPSCVPVYGESAAEIEESITPLFTDTNGPGWPSEYDATGDQLRALLVPHMDYARGGITYGWGFKELVERTDATLFVIIATSHYSGHRFTLTRKNFATPLGIVPTDQPFIDRLVERYGDGLFDDPVAHYPEHSIELEVVLLQYLLGKKRDFRIVPLLVGSFHDCIMNQVDPMTTADIPLMISALQHAERQCQEKICYIISGDLAHIGPKFHHAQLGARFHSDKPVQEPWLSESQQRDHALLHELASLNHRGFFQRIADEQDERNICGLSPTWLTLAACQPTAARILHYGRAVDPKGYESVSFASMAFYS